MLMARAGGFHQPPYAPIKAKLVHLMHFVSDVAYVAPLEPDERSKHFKRRTYYALHIFVMNQKPPTEMRIVKKLTVLPGTSCGQLYMLARSLTS
jgi:hypothetical protein